MPDQLNKQSLINLLIDSPLREPIKINLIDIVNNTSDPDLPKIYSTITKELEIFQKATERRMKLAEDTIAKLAGVATASAPNGSELPAVGNVVNDSSEPTAPTPLSVPPLDLPPLPTHPEPESPIPEPVPSAPAEPAVLEPAPTPPPPPTPQPLGSASTGTATDEDALAEIQKELDSLKTETESELSSDAASPTPAAPPVQQ